MTRELGLERDTVLPRPARHIVWDWNGTLLADNDAVLAAVNKVCAGFERPAVTLAEWRAIYGRPIIHSYERLLDMPIDDAAWARVDAYYHDHYRELLPDCGLAEGALDALRQWRAAGGTQSLLSMWFHDELTPLVADFGLAELFGRVDGLQREVGGDSKVEHMRSHLRAQRLDPAEVVLVGDVVDDAYAAEQAGASCVLVSTGMAPRDELARTGAPVADSLADAINHLLPETGVQSLPH
ncbi:HAD family hydrolase [Tamaricihabitans halophyticus]|nr:HAD family hydrolase [Tamaricihabitans halophyticus]